MSTNSIYGINATITGDISCNGNIKSDSNISTTGAISGFGISINLNSAFTTSGTSYSINNTLLSTITIFTNSYGGNPNYITLPAYSSWIGKIIIFLTGSKTLIVLSPGTTTTLFTVAINTSVTVTSNGALIYVSKYP